MDASFFGAGLVLGTLFGVMIGMTIGQMISRRRWKPIVDDYRELVREMRESS